MPNDNGSFTCRRVQRKRLRSLTCVEELADVGAPLAVLHDAEVAVLAAAGVGHVTVGLGVRPRSRGLGASAWPRPRDRR